MTNLRAPWVAVAVLSILPGASPCLGDAPFRRGDANGDRVNDIADPVAILEYIFVAGFPILCLDAADVNDDGAIDIGDAVYDLAYLFIHADPPPAPHPDCDTDPTPDGLDCAFYPPDVDLRPFWRDEDGDTYGAGEPRYLEGPEGLSGATRAGDCDDADPLIHDRCADSDGDGISDEDETGFWGTDPARADTDGDGLADRSEIFEHHSDPLAPDSDGDGVPDGDEIAAGRDPNARACGADPNGGLVPITWLAIERAPNPRNGVHTVAGVNPATGEVFTRLPLLSLPIAGTSLDLHLVHRSLLEFDGPVGRGWSLECFARLHVEPAGPVRLLDGRGHVGLFARRPDGIFETPPGWYCALESAGGGYALRWPGGVRWFFDPAGRLAEVIDRNGLGWHCAYGPEGNLDAIVDPFGRAVMFGFYATGRVKSIRDWFDGPGGPREIRFTYRDDGSLACVAFPGTAQHAYEKPTYGFLYAGSGIAEVIAPDGRPLARTEYDPVTGRALRRAFGGGPPYVFGYAEGLTTVTSPSGNVTEYSCAPPLVEMIRQFTRGLRFGDPPYFEMAFVHNAHFEIAGIAHPGGSTENFFYDEGNPDPLACGNLLLRLQVPAPGDPAPPIVETWTYEPVYQRVQTHVSPRGYDPEAQPESFLTAYFYDYEEAFLGDLNGDGIVTEDEGNLVLRILPAVTAPEIQPAEERFAWIPHSGRMATSVDPAGTVTRYEYDPSLNLISVAVDPTGLNLRTRYERDSVGRATARIDPAGNRHETEFDEIDRETEIRGPAPSSRRLGLWYDMRGRLGRIDRGAAPMGKVSGDLADSWRTTHLHYDACDGLTHITEEIDAETMRTTRLIRDREGRVSERVKPEGNRIGYDYDERGLLLRETAGLGSAEAAAVEYDCDADGATRGVTDPRGFRTAYVRDGFGRATRVIDARGNYTEYAYDADDNVVSVARYDGASGECLTRTAALYDERGRAFELRDLFRTSGGEEKPDAVSRRRHDPRGLLVGVEDPNGNTSTRAYDAAGRLIETRDAIGNGTLYARDANGNASQVTSIEWDGAKGSSESHVTQSVFDELDREIERREIDARDAGHVLVTGFAYDAEDRLILRVDAGGDTVRFERDALGRLRAKVYELRSGGAKTGEIRIETWYDRNDRIAARKDGNGNPTTYAYNARDELVETTFADGTSKRIDRDPSGNPVIVTDPNGTQVVTMYNEVNLPDSRSAILGPGVIGPATETYTWDAAGRAIALANEVATLNRGFDSLGAIDREDESLLTSGVARILRRIHDAESNALRTESDGRACDRTFDAHGCAKTIAAGGSTVASYAFAGRGARVSGIALGNGAALEVDFDGFAREESRRWSAGAPPLLSYSHAYDACHARIRETEVHAGGRRTEIALDSLGRTIACLWQIDSVTGKPSEDIAYDLDGACNRTRVAVNGVSTIHVPTAVNAYARIGGAERRHDANGNLIDDGTFRYAYGYRNELIEVRRKSDGSIAGSYRYDVLGRRVLRTCAGEGGTKTYRYVHDGSAIVAEYEMGPAGESLFARYVHGEGIDSPLRIEIRDSNDVDRDGDTAEFLTYYYSADSLGSIACLTDARGAIAERYEYGIYGQPAIFVGPGPDGAWHTGDDVRAQESRIGNRFLFHGREWDPESGLYYYRARHYSPATGRFLQGDPAGEWTTAPNLGNRYNFVGCDPFNRTDPLGLDPNGDGKISISEFLFGKGAVSEAQKEMEKKEPEEEPKPPPSPPPDPEPQPPLVPTPPPPQPGPVVTPPAAPSGGFIPLPEDLLGPWLTGLINRFWPIPEVETQGPTTRLLFGSSLIGDWFDMIKVYEYNNETKTLTTGYGIRIRF